MNGKAKRLLGSALLAVVLAGCATTSNNPRDPLEGFNRAMFGFNESLDNAIVKPVAEGYRAVLPQPVRTGVTNFFSNIEDLWIAVNNALQGKFGDAVQDVMRVSVNTVFGIFGLIDVASDAGLPKHNEDFGQTLGRWGVGSGPYLVWPVFGPSNLRDTAGSVVNYHGDLVWQIDHVPTRNTAVTVRGISDRANLLETTDVLEQAALDKYTFVRDAFLQRRRSLIFDGNPPKDSSAAADAEETVAAATEPARPAEPVLASRDAAAETSTPAASGDEGVYTVFADGVALRTSGAQAEPAAAVSVVRFADGVVLQAR